MLLVLAGKAATLLMPFAYKAVIDRMSAHAAPSRSSPDWSWPMRRRALPASFPTICATRCSRRSARTRRGGSRPGLPPRPRSVLRFHLERRTGSLTKVVERGTKSIDMMLYFLLFNIAPTVIELGAICIIFFVKFGAGLVAATLAMVVHLHRLHAPGDRLARATSSGR